MSVIPLAIDIAACCMLAAYLLHRYGNWRKQHVIVSLATFIAWYFSFMIIFVLPIDVSNTCYRQCVKDHTPPPVTTPYAINGTDINDNVTTSPEIHRRDVSYINPGGGNFSSDSTTHISDISMVAPQSVDEACNKPWSYVAPIILPTLWHVVYWTSQALTWLILPMMQSYANAGDFTVAGKIKSSLIENAIYYGTYLLIFGICLIYLAIKPNIHLNWSQLKVLAITASNTWGLFLLVLLLGYGLVEVPRSWWHNSKKGYMLSQTYFKIAKLSTEKSESEENLEDVLDDVKKAAETIRYNHSFRKYVDTVLLKCPESVQSAVARNKDDYEDYNNPTETPTEKSLVRLHKKVIITSQRYRRTQVQWQMMMDKACDLEDIAANQNKSVHTFTRAQGPYEGPLRNCYNPTAEWYWKCWISPVLMKIIAIAIVLLSVMVVWSECLFFVKTPVLSLFALFLDLAKRNYDYVMIEFVCCMTIAYISFCAYYTLFKIRIFNYYYLAAHHQTDENSLIFCGMLLCRLTPPICLNFLGLIHLDSHVTKDQNLEETYYTQIMGHMDIVSFISDGFNIYFPILIVLLCIFTYFNLCTRCIHFLGFQQFIGDDDMTTELVNEGEQLVKREKRTRQRQEEGEQRRRDWNDRFGERREERQREREMEPPRAVRNNGRGFGTAGGISNKVAKSPTENDRTELLKDAEPVDYSDNADSFQDFTPGSHGNNETEGGRYQSRPPAGATRPSSLGAGRFGSTGRSGSRPPPKGIFDDV